MKYDYIHDIEDYTSFDKLQELTAICRAELEHVSWEQFIADIQLTEKETDDDWIALALQINTTEFK